ncbi:hypothetical protein FQA39_LY12356 [Lamprigera yunnana]|nr:hypothetical protein FQA39_LY12356 [Lamprigera yunnana]
MQCLSLIIIIAVSFASSFHISDHKVQVWLNATKDYNKECIADAHANLTYIKTMFIVTDLEDLRATECYFKCIYEKMKFLFPNGTFDQELMVSKIDYYSMDLWRKCEEDVTAASDLCKKSFIFARCVLHHMGKPAQDKVV